MSAEVDSTKLSKELAEELLWDWLLSEDLSDPDDSAILRLLQPQEDEQ